MFEHPGRETFGASVYVARKGGTIVTCASTSGFMHEYDNRYLWMSLKRIIGSHFANYREAWEANRLIQRGIGAPDAVEDVPARRNRAGGVRGAPQHAPGQGRRAVPLAGGRPRRQRPRTAGQALTASTASARSSPADVGAGRRLLDAGHQAVEGLGYRRRGFDRCQVADGVDHDQLSVGQRGRHGLRIRWR